MHSYTLTPFDITALNNTLVFMHSADEPETRGLDGITAQYLEPGYGLFTESIPGAGPLQVSLDLREQALVMQCSCNSNKKKLCRHEARVLFCLMNRKEVRLFFDKQLRRQQINFLRPVDAFLRSVFRHTKVRNTLAGSALMTPALHYKFDCFSF